MGIGLGTGLAISGGLGLLGSLSQSHAASQAAQPLPTYYQQYQSPQQQQMYGYMQPTMQNMYGGGMPSPTLANIGNAPMPTAGWYNNLAPSVKAGIQEPYMQAMNMMRNQLAGTGMLGNPRAGMSGAAADVFGQYMQKAAPAMAQTAWGMMQPGMLQQQGAQNQAALLGQQQGWQGQMLPYQMLPSMLPQTYSNLLVGHTPTIQQIQPGAPMPPNYQNLMQQSIVPQNYPYGQSQPSSFRGGVL